MAIFGRSGAGKTNVAFHILKQLAEKRIPFIFLDWKRTGRHLIPGLKGRANIYTPGRSLAKFPFNPFLAPPGIEPVFYINQVIDIMAEAYTLGNGSKNILQKTMAKFYDQGNLSPTVAEILEEVEKLPEKERVRGWKLSAIRALESLMFSDITAADSDSQQELVQKLLHENTIIELDALSQQGKKFLIPLLCLWLYYVKLGSSEREKLSLAIFVEEAHHVLYKSQQRSKESVLEMLLRQCREIGIAMIVIDQHPHLISSAALGNTYTSICLNLKDPGDINKAAALSQVDDEDKGYFSMLSVGQGIVKLQNRWKRPFLVEFPAVNVRKGMVTDSILTRYLKDLAAGSGRKRSIGMEFSQVQQVQIDDSVLNKEDFDFIQDIIAYPDDGVKTRYKRVGLSIGKGNQIKQRLLDAGWIEACVVEVGNTRKVLLALTKQARDVVGHDAGNQGRVSIEHEYWKRWYASYFAGQGYIVNLEVPRRSGNVDMVARKGQERIAIEIETGKSDVVWNVRQDLLSKYDKVIVVATDENAIKKVEQQLAAAGLIIPKRVEIVLRDRIVS